MNEPQGVLAEHQLSDTIGGVYESLGRRDALRRPDRPRSLGRYHVERLLGAGTSGTVYQARDTGRGLPVALKVLHSFAPARLAQFKTEFRVASGCADPSLVSFFELVEQDQVWAIAMELVDGPPLLEYVRSSDLSSSGGRLDEERLRGALRSIVAGLGVLHEAGILHRDLKPSNVLVGGDGGVRIADFGLAQLFDPSLDPSPERLIVGTPAFMSPEQALGRSVNQATDLYALGVLLYEALTGELPFSGHAIDVLRNKNLREAPDPARLAPDAPDDLLALTRALLQRDPERRPSLAEVRATLQGPDTVPGPALQRRELVGRDHEVQRVLRAFDGAQGAQPLLIRLSGPSGVGKSALVRTLGRSLQARGATVLSGRCHELESIPHKGFDAIVDALRQVLVEWGPERIQRELPPSTVDALPMFPVLGDVLPSAPTAEEHDVNERRRRAPEGMVTLLRAVSASTPLVLVLDDAQWGDAEGGRLLEAILAATPACVRMVVLAYRDSEVAGSALLADLASQSSVERHHQEVAIALAPLSAQDAQRLARQILGADGPAADRIAEESRGEPFLLEQLALAGAREGAHDVTIDDVVLRRARALGAHAFQLIEVASVAGTPLPEQLLTEVVGARDARRALNELVTSSMLRRSGSGPEALVYPYHDRIRTSVEASVDPARKRALHLSIAELGERGGLLPAAALTRHFEGAGELRRAATYALAAGRAAEAALAFESAAAMYGRVLELSDDEAARQDARCARARSLFVAGRCDEAGAAFELAAGHAQGAAARALERQAVEAYLGFGHVREAMAILEPLLAKAGMSHPTSSTGALLAVARTALEVRWRTLLEPRVRLQPDPETAELADLTWSGMGLCNVEPVLGVRLALASLCFAIRSGDGFRIARGLGFAGSGYVPGLVGAGERFLRWCSELAERRQDDHLRVVHRVSSGTRGFVFGDWDRCIQDSSQGLQIATRVAAPTHWEQTVARIFMSGSYEYLGEYRQMETTSREHLRLIRGQGDRIAEVMAVSGLGYTLAARQDAEGLDAVIEDMRRLMSDWTVPYPFWEAFRLRLRCLRALCWGDVRGALGLIEEHWPRLVEHRLLSLPMVRYPMTCLRTSVLLEAAAAGLAERGGVDREVRRAARVLEGAPRAEGPVAAALARAALANLHGRTTDRDRHLEHGIALARQGKMGAAERMAGRALARAHGQVDVAGRLVTELQDRGVADPAAWARFQTPTFA